MIYKRDIKAGQHFTLTGSVCVKSKINILEVYPQTQMHA